MDGAHARWGVHGVGLEDGQRLGERTLNVTACRMQGACERV